MTNRIINKLLTLWLGVFFIPFAYAEIPIQNGGDIAGAWVMESASTKPDGPKVPRGETWTIGAGKLEKTGLLLARSGTYDVPPMDYKIENGKLLLAVVGRPGKFDEYTLIERSGDSMTLYARSDGYLYFKRK